MVYGSSEVNNRYYYVVSKYANYDRKTNFLRDYIHNMLEVVAKSAEKKPQIVAERAWIICIRALLICSNRRTMMEEHKWGY